MDDAFKSTFSSCGWVDEPRDRRASWCARVARATSNPPYGIDREPTVHHERGTGDERLSPGRPGTPRCGRCPARRRRSRWIGTLRELLLRALRGAARSRPPLFGSARLRAQGVHPDLPEWPHSLAATLVSPLIPSFAAAYPAKPAQPVGAGRRDDVHDGAAAGTLRGAGLLRRMKRKAPHKPRPESARSKSASEWSSNATPDTIAWAQLTRMSSPPVRRNDRPHAHASAAVDSLPHVADHGRGTTRRAPRRRTPRTGRGRSRRRRARCRRPPWRAPRRYPTAGARPP